MDALREEFINHRSIYYQPHRGGITFVVNRLRVHNGWAWTFANPQSTDAGDRFGEYNGFLLQLEDGRWAVMKLPAMVNDPDDPENLDYPTTKDIARIKKTPRQCQQIFLRSNISEKNVKSSRMLLTATYFLSRFQQLEALSR